MANKKGVGLKTNGSVLVKDHPNSDVLKRYLGLGDNDPVPNEGEIVHPVAIEFGSTITDDGLSLELTSMTVKFDIYSKSDAGLLQKVEGNPELTSITWGTEEQPAVPAEDVLDDDGNVVEAAGSVRAAIPSLETLMANPQKSGLLDAVRGAFFNEVKGLVPAWSAGVEEEL